jgi:hypothetical protein
MILIGTGAMEPTDGTEVKEDLSVVVAAEGEVVAGGEEAAVDLVPRVDVEVVLAVALEAPVRGGESSTDTVERTRRK